MGRRSMTTTGADKPRSYSGDYMELGRQGSDIVLDWLHQRPQVIGVIDWRDVKVVQEADVDFAIKTRDGRITLAEAKILIEQWRREYNTIRPHSSLGYRPPAPETTRPDRAFLNLPVLRGPLSLKGALN